MFIIFTLLHLIYSNTTHYFDNYYDKHDNYTESVILAFQLTNGEQHAG